jgi:opacity protein-like surface antigen
MVKKMVVVSALLFASSTMTFADSLVPYFGADLGLDYGHWKVRDATGASQTPDATGVFGNLFAGVGWSLTDYFYLGAEMFGNQSSTHIDTIQVNTATGGASTKLRMRYTFGGSLLPGYKFTPATMAYLRLGVVRSRFDLHQTIVPADAVSNWSKNTVTGGQAGIGAQTDFGVNWSARIEYDYNFYHSYTAFDDKVLAHDNQYKIGLLYSFC